MKKILFSLPLLTLPLVAFSQTTLLSEDFESGSIPSTWTVQQTNANQTWGISSDTGSYTATVNYDDALGLQDEWLITPSLDFTNGDTYYNLSFAVGLSYYWSVSPYNNYDARLKISTDGGSSWTTLTDETALGTFTNWAMNNVSIDLSSYKGNSDVKLAFQYYGTDGAALYLDDVLVKSSNSPAYCDIASSYTSFEYISNVNFAGIDNSTAGVAGYNDFTSQIGTIKTNETKALSVSISADSGDYVTAFIDWNQNGSFTDSGESYVLASNTSSDGPFTTNITPPANAVLGETRMRVILRWNVSPTPCTSFYFGEIEDYTVKVEEFLAVNDLSKSKVSIYPNPFTDVIKISDINNISSISVNDISGKLVKTLEPSSEINLSQLKTGLYIINLKMKDGSNKAIKAIKK